MSKRVYTDAMPFEVFDKRALPMVKRPQVTIQAKGTIGLNRACFELLGKPDAVELLYDREAKLIGFRAVDPNSQHAYPMRAVNSGSTYIVAGTRFLNYYDIPIGIARRYNVAMQAGILTLDLNSEFVLAVSNRNLKDTDGSDGFEGRIPVQLHPDPNRLAGLG